MIRRSALPRDDAGATAIEFAFVAGILAVMTLGIFDYGRAFWYRMQVQNAAQAGADWVQYYSFNCGGQGTVCVPSGLQNAVVYATDLLLASGGFTLTASSGNTSTVTASNGNNFTVTASNGNSTCGCPDGNGGMTALVQCGASCPIGGNATGYATVTVSYNYTPFFPRWPGLGTPVALTGSATAICEGGETC